MFLADLKYPRALIPATLFDLIICRAILSSADVTGTSSTYHPRVIQNVFVMSAGFCRANVRARERISFGSKSSSEFIERTGSLTAQAVYTLLSAGTAFPRLMMCQSVGGLVIVPGPAPG